LQLFEEQFLRKLERLAIHSRRALSGQLQGERRSPKRGQSVEFADFRPYTPGDDFRRIDWNAYARLERFFIKLFVEEEDLTVHLLLDTSRSMDWGEPNKLNYAVRTAGALGYIALAGLDRVTVTALNDDANRAKRTLPPRRGKQQAGSLFTFLQNLSGGGNLDLASRLKQYAITQRPVGPLILLSDLMDEGWQEGLRALAMQGFEVTLLQILAPEELDPTLNGDFKLLDSENNSEVEITADYELLQRYQRNRQAWQSEIQKFCSARQMHYIPVDTAYPFEELFFSMLRRRGVLR